MTEKNPPDKNPKGGRKDPNRRKKDDDKFEWKKARSTLLVWILIVVVAFILFQQFSLPETPEKELSYSQYRKQLEAEQIESAEVLDQEFHGLLRDGTGIVTILPFIDQKMIAEWDSLKIDYLFREKRTGWLGYLIMNIFPWILFIGIWLYIMKRMQGGGQRGLFSFGKSRAKLMVESKLKVTFNDVAGCDEAKEELHEVIEFLQDPKKFTRLGGRIPKGALLLGPPGTGKTLLARAVAGEADVPFFSMSGADFVEMFVGVGASRVRDLFEQGKKSAPCIIFIDEIDAVGRQRGAGLGGGHDEREQTLNQLLVEMDGFESNDGVILIAATNRPDVLDPALTRPGRFDRQIVVDRPDVRGREGILKVHAREIPLASDVRLDVLAKGTPGMSGADLANLVNEAALLAARRTAEKVFMVDFENSKDKVMMGTERRSLIIAEDEKRQTAYHEAGHVLVSKLIPGSDPVHKVTIIPRGRALGLTHYLPLDEKHNYSRSYLNVNLVHLLGGRAAERLIFSELTTGAGNDIERATEIANKMVCAWGMSDKIGPIALGKKNEEVFIGRDFMQQREFSEKTAQVVDSEIRAIVVKAERHAEKLLRENIKNLHALAEALLDREILDGNEIDIILKGGKLPPIVPKTSLPIHSSSKQPERKRPAARPRAQATRSRQTTRPKPTEGKKPVVKDKPTAKPAAKAAPKSRRQTARSLGVASSRDPRNRRPSSRELAGMDNEKPAPIKAKTPRRTVRKKPVAPAPPPEASTPVKDESTEPKKPVARRRTRTYRSRITAKPDQEVTPTQAPTPDSAPVPTQTPAPVQPPAPAQAPKPTPRPAPRPTPKPAPRPDPTPEPVDFQPVALSKAKEDPADKPKRAATRRAPIRRRTSPMRRPSRPAIKKDEGSESDGD